MPSILETSPPPIIAPVNGKHPEIDPSAMVAPTAAILGDVTLGPRVSVWFGAVLRGDINAITVGEETNLQDGMVIHVSHTGPGTIVGRQVVVGHKAVLHSCTIGDRCLIGMGSVILDRAVVGDDCVIAAGAVVSPGMEIPPMSMVMGVPGRVVRQLTEAELERNRGAMDRYLRVQECYKDGDLVVDFSKG